MKWRLPSIRRSWIGLDIGSARVKAAQLVHLDGRWSIERAASLPRPAADSISVNDAIQLRQVLCRHGFIGNGIVLSIPSSLQLSAILELPPRTPDLPIDQIARSEFARIHSCEPDATEMAYWDLPAPARAAKATYLMAVGCGTSQLEKSLESFSLSGFETQAVDHLSSAVARAVLAFGGAEGIIAFVDLGNSASTIAVMMSGVLVYERRIAEISGQSLSENIKKQLSLDDDECQLMLEKASLASDQTDAPGASLVRDILQLHAERLAQELKLAFSYIARQYSEAVVSKVILVGGGALVGGINQFITDETGVISEPFDPTARTSQGILNSAPAMAGAVGLALFGTQTKVPA